MPMPLYLAFATCTPFTRFLIGLISVTEQSLLAELLHMFCVCRGAADTSR